jgi:alpha-glucosidase
MNLMQDVARDQIVAPDKDWWRGAVIYQIYPRSFQDSNHDGIGDLAGIIHRLHHVAELGVDAIWISPFFRSPMLDFGYDVSDYRDVDPMFGTLGDFDALIHRAHELGLKVLIDLVLSHTSNQHAWFQESVTEPRQPEIRLVCLGRRQARWQPAQQLAVDLRRLGLGMVGRPDAVLPAQLPQGAARPEPAQPRRAGRDAGRRALLAGSRGRWVPPRHDQLLLPRQGVAGQPRAGARRMRNATIAPEVNPYNWQDHLYDKNQPENLEFLRRLRALMDEYPAATAVGEVGDAQYGLQIQAEYTSGGDKVHMCYSFEFLSGIVPTPERVGEVVTDTRRPSATAGPAGRFPTMT